MNAISHTDEEKRWPLVQGSVTHMFVYCEQLQQDSHIEIVVNGRAVRQLKEGTVEQLEYKAVLYGFIKHSVIITACRSTMKGQRVEEQELLDGVTTVVSNVMELAVKQQAGYSYIKP